MVNQKYLPKSLMIMNFAQSVVKNPRASTQTSLWFRHVQTIIKRSIIIWINSMRECCCTTKIINLMGRINPIWFPLITCYHKIKVPFLKCMATTERPPALLQAKGSVLKTLTNRLSQRNNSTPTLIRRAVQTMWIMLTLLWSELISRIRREILKDQVRWHLITIQYL